LYACKIAEGLSSENWDGLKLFKDLFLFSYFREALLIQSDSVHTDIHNKRKTKSNVKIFVSLECFVVEYLRVFGFK